MDYSYFLKTSVPDEAKLLTYGFTKSEQGLYFKQNISDTEFYAGINITSSAIIVHTYEAETDERYALFDMASANGAFIGEIRNKVNQIMKDILSQCFTVVNVYEQYVNYVKETFSCDQDFPWGDDASVFRCADGKWFALVMNIPFKSLGVESEERVWAVNLKTDPELIPILVDKKSIFPAYHMNKKYWVTVLLTAVTDFKKLKALTEESYYLVDRKN